MSDVLVNDVNNWRNYRDPTSIPLTKDEVQAFYRRTSFATRPDAAPAPRPPLVPKIIPFTEPPRRLPPRYKRPTAQLQRQFIDQNNVPGIPVSGASWRGARFLGQGGFALAGLFEWIGPEDQKPKVDKLVVKQLRLDTPQELFDNEAEKYEVLNQVQSPHIVRMIHEPQRVVLGSAEGLGPEWDGRIRRLFLEYCPNGSMWDLWAKHHSEQTPFSELTIWLLFECLIDAITVLEYGAEFTEDVNGNPDIKFPDFNWDCIKHFDLHMSNIFLAGRDRKTHPNTPLCKLGDFGLSEFVYSQESSDQTPESIWINETFRDRGMPGYRPPEQFTERWDYSDFETSGIAGVYGSWSMIWSAAAIMYQLLTLTPSPPPPTTLFHPPFPLGSPPSPALGPTYGPNMQAYPYSTTLKSLLYECLYEVPSHRPSLDDLKLRIWAGISACLDTNASFDTWDAFLPDEPIDNPIPFPVGPGVVPPLPLGGVPPAMIFAAGGGPVVIPGLGGAGVLKPPRRYLCNCTRDTAKGVPCKNSRLLALPHPRTFDCGRHGNGGG